MKLLNEWQARFYKTTLSELDNLCALAKALLKAKLFKSSVHVQPLDDMIYNNVQRGCTHACAPHTEHLLIIVVHTYHFYWLFASILSQMLTMMMLRLLQIVQCAIFTFLLQSHQTSQSSFFEV